MAIGFLAPQNTEEARDQARATAQASDVATSNPRSPMEALPYGVEAEASLNARSHARALPQSAVPCSHDARASGTLSMSSSQHSTPSTSPRHDDLDGTGSSRERRDPYSEEMQFYIMFARITKELDWRKIEDEFEGAFDQRRPRDGLTAVYYRIRTRWGMPQVLKSGSSDKCHDDAKYVHARARAFSSRFLKKIGYVQPPHQEYSLGG